MKGRTMAEDLTLEDDKEVEKVLERNNAQIVPMGSNIPIIEYEVYNSELQIWKGKLAIPPGSGAPDIIYFSRKYQPDINELDQIFVEIEIEDTDLLGVPFILVPKEKFLFGYFRAAGEGIIIPNKKIKLSPHMQ
jgi:hypothetical protein